MSRDERGQSTVEFALVLPVILLLLLGLLQAGVLFRDQLVVAAAAREAAREAAVTADHGKIAGAARRAAPGLRIDVEVVRGQKRGDRAAVVITAQPTKLPLVGKVVARKRLRAEATMRVEQAS